MECKLHVALCSQSLLFSVLELTRKYSFHCLFCHGFEERGAVSAGVLAMGPMLGGAGGPSAPLMAPVIARMAARLAARVTVYTDGNEELGTRIREALKSPGKFHIENRRVVSLSKDPHVEGDAGVIVALEDGSTNSEMFLVSSLLPLFCPAHFIHKYARKSLLVRSN